MSTSAELSPSLWHVAVEGTSDFFFGRPFDANPYSRSSAGDAWEAWRDGWLQGSQYEQLRGDEERPRWLSEAA